jgi:alkylation response protein AidB-like acyl-CoA dehydrogenase
MDLSFTKEELAFRDEVRAWVRDALPEDIRRRSASGLRPTREHLVRWQRILADKGWAAPHWAPEWGGTGWSPAQLFLFKEEIYRAEAPEVLGFNINMLGPVLIAFGTESQKKRFLPKILRLDTWFCQGFSEPGAGSDLAALKTAARREGDHYIVNGQKIWTTTAHMADWIFALVRTDPKAKKQEGISFLLADMKTPGITVRPIRVIDGGRELNEVFFDDVKVPAENLVHLENKGWDVAKFLLGNERTGIARIGLSLSRLRMAKRMAAEAEEDGRKLIENERFREKLALLEVELKALEITQLRVVSASRYRPDATKPDPNSSILKIKGSELQQLTTEAVMEVAGPLAMPAHPGFVEGTANTEPFVPEWAASSAPNYFFLRAATIFGGSSEVQRNIIAKAFLGL